MRTINKSGISSRSNCRQCEQAVEKLCRPGSIPRCGYGRGGTERSTRPAGFRSYTYHSIDLGNSFTVHPRISTTVECVFRPILCGSLGVCLCPTLCVLKLVAAAGETEDSLGARVRPTRGALCVCFPTSCLRLPLEGVSWTRSYWQASVTRARCFLVPPPSMPHRLDVNWVQSGQYALFAYICARFGTTGAIGRAVTLMLIPMVRFFFFFFVL